MDMLLPIGHNRMPKVVFIFFYFSVLEDLRINIDHQVLGIENHLKYKLSEPTSVGSSGLC